MLEKIDIELGDVLILASNRNYVWNDHCKEDDKTYKQGYHDGCNSSVISEQKSFSYTTGLLQGIFDNFTIIFDDSDANNVKMKLLFLDQNNHNNRNNVNTSHDQIKNIQRLLFGIGIYSSIGPNHELIIKGQDMIMQLKKELDL
jgi:hypothetical protein